MAAVPVQNFVAGLVEHPTSPRPPVPSLRTTIAGAAISAPTLLPTKVARCISDKLARRRACTPCTVVAPEGPVYFDDKGSQAMLVKRALAVTLTVLLAGCAAMRQDKYCKWAMPAWGVILGGVGGGLATSETGDGRTDAERAGGAAGGVIAGGLIGWLVGHYVCEAAPEAAPPPPPPPPPPSAPRKIETLEGANFDVDKATLRPEGVVKVDHAAKVLKESPRTRVSVEGHTDSTGSHVHNQKLSERRARTVADRLIEQGVSAERITTRGYGETRPIASNKTEETRAKNRRVEIIAE